MSETEARDSDDAPSDDASGEVQDGAPDEEVPDEGAPDEEVPGEEVPGEEAPGEEVPGEEAPGEEAPDDDVPDEEPEPSWWHRSHPTFAGLVGFFTGVAFVIVVPGVYAALLGLLLSDATAQKLFPLVLVALVVPVALLVPRKTRRFAQFMFLGILSTVVVVGVTAAVVIWALVKIEG